MINFISQNFLDYHYWFTMSPAPLTRAWLIGATVAFVLFIVVGIAAGVYAKRLKRTGNPLTAQGWRCLRKFGWWGGIVGLLLVWFRYEQVSLLGARFWWVAVAIWLGWWAVLIAIFVFKKLPQNKMIWEQKKAFEKYLP